MAVIRYVVTSLAGSPQHLYENVYCQRGQMENLIKLHKAQLASDRMWSRSATANQVRLVLHTAAFWLMHGVRAAIPVTSPLASCEFATIRERLIKIGARVIEHIARIATRAALNLRRMVAIEFGTWRSGRNGGAPRPISFGNCNFFEQPGGTSSSRGNHLPLGDQESICRDA